MSTSKHRLRDLHYLLIRLLLAFLKISTCSSLYASWIVMILHRFSTLTDLLGYCRSV
ncbi:uncharacterized protein F5147DRAFT_838026 [Suillus discolor]|uniref:Uncharacterized protein n=1 Tax=Suillus discolor TaxID=1912936 RepID=A0A9P7JSQ8_9AGAM|nr:uncharacterized protein F5147DRAFT_838026 [Suillus discolor]KAG2105831.1 hypothetical protein F5147DRAFT_838026 [Suillus discolor]